MSDELLFTLLNYSTLPGWALLWFLPRHAITRAVVHSGAYAVLLGVPYALLLFGDQPGPQGANFFTLDGVSHIFTTPRTIIACWVHYLIFDLFVGAWIGRDCERLRLKPWAAAPSQVLTLFFGPIGLVSWLAIRALRERAMGAAQQPSVKP